MTTCPKCGSPMRLMPVSPSDLRTWKCTNSGFYVEDPCFHTEQIADGHKLSALEIASSIKASSGFSTSEDFKKDQANVRRILGGLKKLDLDAYVSKSERSAIATVTSLLTRMGDAAEKAKKLKIQDEVEEKNRRAEREKMARGALFSHYKTNELDKLVVHLLAISEQTSGFSTRLWGFDSLTDVRLAVEQHGKDKPYTNAKNRIIQGLGECVDVSASDIGASKYPLPDLLKSTIAEIDERIVKIKKLSYGRLDEFSAWLNEQRVIEFSEGKVVRLKS